MATQAASRNMADVVQMDRYLYEYARRRRLEPLDEHMGKGARPQPVRPEVPGQRPLPGQALCRALDRELVRLLL